LRGSGGEVRPVCFLPLLEVFSLNRTLKKINLHFIKLLDSEVQITKDGVTVAGGNDYSPGKTSSSFNKPGEEFPADLKLTPLGEQVFFFMSKLVSRSKQLEHLDLSYTSLSEPFLVRFASVIKKSKSLLGMHLSGNLGVTLRTKMTFKAVLNCQNMELPRSLTPEGPAARSRANSTYRNFGKS